MPPFFASFYNEALGAAEAELKNVYIVITEIAQAYGWPPSEINKLYVSGGEPHECLFFWGNRAEALIKARAKTGKI